MGGDQFSDTNGTTYTPLTATGTRAFDPYATSHLDPQAVPDHRPHNNWNGWHNNLTNGQKIGLVMGVVVGTLGGMLFMCACHFFWNRYRKCRKSSPSNSYPSSLSHLKDPSNRRWPWSRFRKGGKDSATSANPEAPFTPSELPANPLSVVPGCVEIGNQDAITTCDNPVVAAHAVAPGNTPLEALSPASNTTVSSERTRSGSYYGLPKISPLSPTRNSASPDDDVVEHAVRAIGSRGQLVSHSLRLSIRPFENGIEDENGLLSDGELEAVDELKTESDEIKHGNGEGKAVEMPV